MWALAKQQEWMPSYEDERLTGIVSQAVAMEADISSVGLAPGGGIGAKSATGKIVAGGGAGPELRLVLKVREGLGRAELQALAARLQRRLGGDPDFMERVDSLEISFTR